MKIKDPRVILFAIHFLFLLLGAGNLFIEWRVPDEAARVQLRTELNVALIITSLIGFASIGIESISQRRFREHVDELLRDVEVAVFDAIFKKLVPVAIFEEVRENILLQPFLRRNYAETIVLKHATGVEASVLELETVTDYELFNISAEPRTFRLSIRVSLSPGYEDRAAIKGVSIARGSRIENLFDPDMVVRENAHLLFEKDIHLDRDEWVRISTAAVRIVPQRNHLAISMAHQTENLSVTVLHPDDIVVKAFADHPSPNRLQIMTGQDILSCRLEGGILPNQGISLYWYPGRVDA